MSVSNNLIDSEHKYLIEQINLLETALIKQDNHDIVAETLEHLVSYTNTHFKHEETIQRKIQYPQLEQHQQEHKQLMKKLYAIKSRLDGILNPSTDDKTTQNQNNITDDELDGLLDDHKHDLASVNEDDLEPLILLIRSWLIDHVIGSDLKLKPYLSKRPADFA